MEVLRIRDVVVKLKEGERADELVSKIERLIKKFSEPGNWWFRFEGEAGERTWSREQPRPSDILKAEQVGGEPCQTNTPLSWGLIDRHTI